MTIALFSRRYGDNFKGFYITQHQIKVGEIAGKSSNENWAVRCMKRYAARLSKTCVEKESAQLTVGFVLLTGVWSMSSDWT